MAQILRVTARLINTFEHEIKAATRMTTVNN
jgi:hypothetical protein